MTATDLSTSTALPLWQTLYINVTGVVELFDQLKGRADVRPLETTDPSQREFGFQNPDGCRPVFTEHYGGACVNRHPTINTPPQGRTVAVVGDVYRFLVTGAETNGAYALWEAFVPPGGGPPPHVHSREEEGFYVLDGEVTFTIDGERVVAKAGTFANMPVGTPHAFKNESDRPARMLISVVPAGLEGMFFEVGVPQTEGATVAPPPTKDQIEKLLAVAPKYGIQIPGPVK